MHVSWVPKTITLVALAKVDQISAEPSNPNNSKAVLIRFIKRGMHKAYNKKKSTTQGRKQ